LVISARLALTGSHQIDRKAYAQELADRLGTASDVLGLYASELTLRLKGLAQRVPILPTTARSLPVVPRMSSRMRHRYVRPAKCRVARWPLGRAGLLNCVQEQKLY
jgi:hypothetical protein